MFVDVELHDYNFTRFLRIFGHVIHVEAYVHISLASRGK